MRKLKSHFLIFIRGVAMGGADIVPGVSGGTIAFITGIYQRLLDAINSINSGNLKHLLRFEIRLFWKAVDGEFLLALVLGIATSVFSLSSLISYLMTNNPITALVFLSGAHFGFSGVST